MKFVPASRRRRRTPSRTVRRSLGYTLAGVVVLSALTLAFGEWGRPDDGTYERGQIILCVSDTLPMLRAVRGAEAEPGGHRRLAETLCHYPY
jgi:hypothetical protein